MNEIKQVDYMTLKEAASQLKCSPDLILKLIDKKLINPIKKPWKSEKKFTFLLSQNDYIKLAAYVKKYQIYRFIKREFKKYGKSRQVAESWIKKRIAEGKNPELIYNEAINLLINSINDLITGKIIPAHGLNVEAVVREHNRLVCGKDIETKDIRPYKLPNEILGIDYYHFKLEQLASYLDWDYEKIERSKTIIMYLENNDLSGLSEHLEQFSEFKGIDINQDVEDIKNLILHAKGLKTYIKDGKLNFKLKQTNSQPKRKVKT